jgi:hypothetical protein
VVLQAGSQLQLANFDLAPEADQLELELLPGTGNRRRKQLDRHGAIIRKFVPLRNSRSVNSYSSLPVRSDAAAAPQLTV